MIKIFESWWKNVKKLIENRPDGVQKAAENRQKTDYRKFQNDILKFG